MHKFHTGWLVMLWIKLKMSTKEGEERMSQTNVTLVDTRIGQYAMEKVTLKFNLLIKKVFFISDPFICAHKAER